VGHFTVWQAEHSEALTGFIKDGFSYAQAAAKLNALFNTVYSRNAAIGRAQRMKLVCPPRASRFVNAQERYRFQSEKRKLERWQAKPSLKELAERRAARKEMRSRMDQTQTSKTSPCYRKHMERLPEMTKNQLRAMLTQAMVNTAAMEVLP